jgi:hypothetical protein
MPDFFIYWDALKSVKYVAAWELTLAQSRNSRGAGGGDGVPFGIFPRFIRGWSGLELSLTCRQGAFSQDLASSNPA